MRQLSRISLCLLVLSLFVFSMMAAVGELHAASPAGTQRPNLLFVFADQMRGSALGCLGEEPVITPHLDQFAKQSVVFTQAASNYPVCSPYRAMLMTGRYPHHNGVTGNCLSRTAPYGVQLKQDARCWSDVLKQQGYALGYIGKWHLEAPYKPYIDCANNRGNVAWNEWTPPSRRHGFDYWYAYNTYDYHLRPLYWDTDAPRDGFHYVDQWGPEHEADLAIAFINNKMGPRRRADQPFALVVSMNPPHTPYSMHPKKYEEPYADMSTEALCKRPNIPAAGTKYGDYYRKNVRNYYAMITGVDEQVGRIIDALDAAGLGANTLVVFTSDHGNCLGIHDHSTKNVPEEESMRVPLLVRYPGVLTPRRDPLLISTPDLYPTMLDLMGLADQTPPTVDGTSLATRIQHGSGAGPRSQLYLWMPPERPELGRRGVRTDRYTLIISKVKDEQTPETILFDRKTDPYQMHNIAGAQPQVVERLTREYLLPWLQKTDDPCAFIARQ